MKTFFSMIDELAAAPVRQRPAIEKRILKTFQRQKAVLALDMSGFTLTVRRHGILFYLCQVRQMHRLTSPIVSAHHGEVVKYEADNLMAVFDDPACAVEAAMAMIQATSVDPARGEKPLNFSIGIDYGKVLFINGADCFGDAVNLAHKLGEDIAKKNEVLITAKVRAQLKGSGFRFRKMDMSLSGLNMVAYGVSSGDPSSSSRRSPISPAKRR